MPSPKRNPALTEGMTQADIYNFVAEHYADRGVRWIAARLGLSERAIHRMKDKLKLKALRPVWTEEQDARLMFLWAEFPLSQIAEDLGRSPNSCYRRASHLGIGCGCPQGMELITASAKRTGYSVATLRKILKWSGVLVHRAQTRPGSARSKRKPVKNARVHWFVDPERVTEAVEAWLATEEVQSAADRYGVSWRTFARHLTRHPDCPPQPGNLCHWRVPTTLLDEVGPRVQDSVRIWLMVHGQRWTSHPLNAAG